MYRGLYWDNTLILLLPAIVLSFYAQTKVSSTTAKYFKVRSSRGYTGAQAAREILDRNGLRNVPVSPVGGHLTDHYDPRNRSVSLSEDVYYGNSVTSVAIAAHECGHAIQHQLDYSPLTFRSFLARPVQFASGLSWVFILGGLLFTRSSGLLMIGIALFSLTVLFQIVTLPVEFNASSRALNQIQEMGIVDPSEYSMSKKVLGAAALTYVAAALAAVSQLLRLLVIFDRRR